MKITRMLRSGDMFVENSYINIFTRFFRYGLLAWGGPIAQLALIQREMVYQEKLISVGYFNRLIAIYQAFPGPETHEICIHLGTQAKGPIGGFLAGLGFMLPGFVLTMLFSWLYILYGITTLVTGILLGIKPAVIAWIIKGSIQLGRGILVNYVAWIIAIAAFCLELLNVNFIITFILAGVLYSILARPEKKGPNKFVQFFMAHKWWILCVCSFLALCGIVILIFAGDESAHIYKGLPLSTFLFGLQCGSLSFGSVYSILSIIKTTAISKYGWITQHQFIDGLAITGVLPAPFIIVTTFVGYLAYGFWGGILSTLGTFLLPFLIPMFGYTYLNRIGTNIKIRTFLDGITAGVAGLIAADVVDILKQVLISPLTIGIFIGALIFIYLYKSTYAIIWIVTAGGLAGLLLAR